MTEDRQRIKDVVTLIVPSHPKYLYVMRSALYPIVIDAGFSNTLQWNKSTQGCNKGETGP